MNDTFSKGILVGFIVVFVLFIFTIGGLVKARIEIKENCDLTGSFVVDGKPYNCQADTAVKLGGEHASK